MQNSTAQRYGINVARTLDKILDTFGNLKIESPVSYKLEYDDGKLVIEGFLDNSFRNYQTFYVYVKMRDESLEKTFDNKPQQVEANFKLPQRNTDVLAGKTSSTLVFQARIPQRSPNGDPLVAITQYFRAGRWLNHCTDIYELGEKLQEELKSRQYLDFDDSKLFPDLETPIFP